MTALIEVKAVDVMAARAMLLRHVDLAVQAGETVAIVGPNGAGKSTLLRVLSGELRPHAGTVHLKGRELGAYAPRGLARHRAVLSQSITVAFPFTVAEIVRMGSGDTRSRQTKTFVESALAEVGLVASQDRVVTTLSGGEQHRAHLARVLVQLACGEQEHGPGLLLLDEPTANLDLRHQVDFVALTRLRARCGTAVVAVLHDLNLAATFADRIVVLQGGAVVADGSSKATITPEVLGRVFDVCAMPGEAPVDGTPFILPQMIAARADWRTGQVSR
jgi:iron complex transport system ATP-binding protein